MQEFDENLPDCGIEELYGKSALRQSPETKGGRFRCKYCKAPVPEHVVGEVNLEVWAGYHMKAHHRDLIHELAKKRASWLESLERGVNSEQRWRH